MIRKINEDIKLDYCDDSLSEIKRLTNEMKRYLTPNDFRLVKRFEVEADDDFCKSVRQDLMAVKGYMEKASEMLDDIMVDVTSFMDEL